MVFKFVTTQKYMAKSKCSLQNCYPPENLSMHTVLILLRNLEKHTNQVFLFENYSPRMLS